MKVKLLLLLTLVYLGFTPSVLAQTSTPLTRREVKKTEISLRLSAIRRERIRSYFGKMIVRIEATIERLEKLITRIESRIGDNSKVQETVNKAKTELAKAKLELATLKLQLENLLESDDPKLVFGQIQDSLKIIKGYLRKTHVLLVQTIGELKGLRVGNNNNEE